MQAMEEVKIPLPAAIDIIDYFSGIGKKEGREETLFKACRDHARFICLRQAEQEAYKKMINAGGEKAEQLKEEYMEIHLEKVALQNALYSNLIV